MNLSSIPQFTQARYRIDVSLDMIDFSIERYVEEYNLEICPDYQRGHVWTEAQQIAFCEYLLRGGESGREIIFNHPGWQRSYKGTMTLVDGLQRLTAIRKMLNNEIKVFGHFLKDYSDHDIYIRGISLIFRVGNIATRSGVIKWYLDMNTGGTPHSQAEIDRVKELWRTEAARDFEKKHGIS